MGKSLRSQPAPALHRPRRRRPAQARSIHPGTPLAAAHRGPPRRRRHRDGRQAVARPARAPGTSMWSALTSVRGGASTVAISCGNTGALMALAMLCLRKAPGRQPAGDRRALAVAEPAAASTSSSTPAPTSAPTATTCSICGDGRLLRPQRPRPEAPARRPAQRRHRGAQGPRASCTTPPTCIAAVAPGQRLRVHRLRRGQRHALGARRRHRLRRLHRQRRAEDRRGHRE